MKKILATLSLSLILTGCSSVNRNVSNLVFPPYGDSDQRKGEQVELELSYEKKTSRKDIKKKCNDLKNELKNELKKKAKSDKAVVEFAAQFAAPSALKMATEQVQEFLKKEAERYTGSYSAVAAGDHFYTQCLGTDDQNLCPDDQNLCPDRIHLNELKLTRSLSGEKKGSELVSELVFKIEPSIDGTAFQVKPKSIEITRSKAKIAAFDITRPFGFDILAPWTIFQADSFSPKRPKKVDVTAEVSIVAVWIDEEQKGHSEVIATRRFNFGSVPLGTKKEYKDDSFLAQLFPAIPRSVIYSKGYNQPALLGPGNFIVSVLVTEYDDYAERVMELEQGVEKNKESFINRLTDGM